MGVQTVKKVRRTQKRIFQEKRQQKFVKEEERFCETPVFAVCVNRPLAYKHMPTGAVSLLLRFLDSLPVCQKNKFFDTLKRPSIRMGVSP